MKYILSILFLVVWVKPFLGQTSTSTFDINDYNLNTYLDYDSTTLNKKVDAIYEEMNLQDSFSLSQSLQDFTLLEQYTGISLDSIIRNIDWNEIASKVDWNQVFENFDWNPMIAVLCDPQHPETQTATSPIQFEIPDSLSNHSLQKNNDYMDCFSISENPMEMMKAINMPCFMQLMQKLPLDSLINGSLSPTNLGNILEGNQQLPNSEVMCELMQCIDMNELFKNMDWNCLMNIFDFNLILKNWKMDKWIQQSDSINTSNAQKFALEQMKSNPWGKAIVESISPDSLLSHMKFAFEDFFTASDLKALNQNFYHFVFEDNLSFKIAASPKMEELIKLVAAFMSNYYGDTKELRYFITYFLTHLEMQQYVLNLDFEAALEKQKLLKDIMIYAYQKGAFQQLWKNESAILKLFSKEMELQYLGSIFQMIGHSSAELGQYTTSLNYLNIAAVLKNNLIKNLGSTPLPTPYLQASFSKVEQQMMMKKHAISQDLVDIILKDLLLTEQHPKGIQQLLQKNNIDDAIEYYLVLKDIVLERGAKNQVSPSFKIPNELAEKLLELEFLKKIYDNIVQIIEQKHSKTHPLYSFYKKATPSLTKLKIQQDLVLFYNEIGGTYFQLRNYEAALKNLTQALNLLKSIENLDYILFTIPGVKGMEEDYLDKLPIYISIINNIAQIQLSRKAYSKTIHFLQEELNYIRNLAKQEQSTSPVKTKMINLEQDLFLIYNVLGTACLQQQYFSQALDYYNICDSIAQSSQKIYWKYQAQINLGNYWQTQNNNTKALTFYKRAKTMAISLNYPYGQSASYVHLGSVLLKQGDINKAFQYFDKAVTISKPLYHFDVLYWCHTYRGQHYMRMNQPSAALSHFQQGIHIVEDSLLINLKGEISRQLAIANGFECYKGAITTAIQLNKEELAFQYIQQSKARTLAETLTSTYFQSSQVPEALQIQQNDILIGLSHTNDINKQDSLLRALEIVKAEIRTTNPNFNQLLTTSFTTIKEVQNTLQPNQAFIEYFMADSTFSFVITSKEVKFFQLKQSKTITSKVQKFQQLIATYKDKPSNRTKTILDQRSHELFSVLFQPIRGYLQSLKINQLIISPDAALYSLPFEILKITPKTPTFLIDEFETYYSPSATAYNSAVFQQLKQKDITKDLLIVAKSNFPEYATTYQLTNLTPNWQSIYNKFDTVDTLLDEKAHYKNLSNINNYRHLYFHTHGILNDSIPELSFLALNSKPLFLINTFDLKLNCENIVLAACNSGKGKFQRGSGLMGFTRSLMSIGAKSVTLSLWSPKEYEANQFFEKYYDYIAKGKSPNKALHLSKLDFKNSENSVLKNPYFWGTFVLYGARREY